MGTQSHELRRLQTQPLTPVFDRYEVWPLGQGDCIPHVVAGRCKKCGAIIRPTHLYDSPDQWHILREMLSGVQCRSLTRRPQQPSKRLSSQSCRRGLIQKALFWLALCLGAREGELLGLQWTDFDFEKETVSVRRSVQRTNREGEKKSHLELVRQRRPKVIGASGCPGRPRKGARASKPRG